MFGGWLYTWLGYICSCWRCVSVENVEDSSVEDWGVSDDVGVSGSLIESAGSGSGSEEEGGVLAWGGGCGALEVPAG